MARRLLCRLMLAGCALAANNLVAQNITVTVKDSVTLEPLEGVAVSLYAGDQVQVTDTTDANGEALLVLTVDSEREAVPAKGWAISHPYPNPTPDRSRVILMSEASQGVVLGLYDILGRRLASWTAGVEAGRQDVELDLGGLPAGAYVLRAASNNGRQLVRMISKSEWTGGTPSIRISAGHEERMGAGGAPARKTAVSSAVLELRAEKPAYIHARRRIDLFGDTELMILLRHASVPDTVNSVGMAFRRIPRGTFMMGSEGVSFSAYPVHPVTLTRDFHMGVYEVTQNAWREMWGGDPSRFPNCPGEVDDNCPVERVPWSAAAGYANALSIAEGLPACYDVSGNVVDPDAGGNVYQCRGYRLPTEAEWEYATRAGTTTDYSFGEDFPPTQLDDYAWYRENSEVNGAWSTHPVGGKLPNPWGLYDVHGNVWEYVHDWYSNTYYGSSPSTDPPGPAAGSYRVWRGGGWNESASMQRSALRHLDPGPRNTSVGFRLARTIF